MANIKSGEEIKEMYDVQNIVTACILGAEKPFRCYEMVKIVEQKCEGSSIKITSEQIQEVVQDTIVAFQRITLVTAYNGQYYAYPCEAMKV